jgi:SAM-dependent methyltransferase
MPSKLDLYYETNRRWWDGVVPIHEASRGYDREGFLRGEKPLCPVELAELGPRVSGKSLLHLQCHFGMDTLGWARLGARVTGLDFSEPALEAARRLSADSGIPGRFVHANVYDATQALEGETFDIVYTGIGALCWLPDVARWARTAAACLAPGGALYVYEGHPVLWSLQERDDDVLAIVHPYFELAEPQLWEGDTTYTDGPKTSFRRNYMWNHGLGEIVSALLAAGLRLEFLREHREVPWRALPSMAPVGPGIRGADGAYASNRMWRLPERQRELVPLMYSLLALKPEA